MSTQTTNETLSILWRFIALLKACGLSVNAIVDGKEVRPEQVEQMGQNYDIFSGLLAEEIATDYPITGLKLAFASGKEVEDWSYGWLKDSKLTRRGMTTKNGPISERTFGPRRAFRCECGRYSKEKFLGIVCERCGVEVTIPTVRFYRFGHAEFGAPVSNPLTLQAMTNLPVLPAGLREDGWSDLTVLYSIIAERNLKGGSIQPAVDALFFNTRLTGRKVRREGRVLKCLADCFDEISAEVVDSGIMPKLVLGDLPDLARSGEITPVTER